MKLKKTLAALTATLTLAVSVTPVLSSAVAVIVTDWDSLTAEINSGVYGEKTDDSGFFRSYVEGKFGVGTSYDFMLKETGSSIIVVHDYVQISGELSDYYKEHTDDLNYTLGDDCVKKGGEYYYFTAKFNPYKDGTFSGKIGGATAVEDAQEFCDSLKEKGIIKSFECNTVDTLDVMWFTDFTIGEFDFIMNEETLEQVSNYLAEQDISFTYKKGTLVPNTYTLKLETEMTVPEQLKLGTDILNAFDVQRNIIIPASSEKSSFTKDEANPEKYIIDMYAISPATAPKSIYGDVDQNGDVTLADAVSIVSYIANPAVYPLTEAQLNRADVENTGDGVNTADALAVQSYLLESVESLPVSYVEQ